MASIDPPITDEHQAAATVIDKRGQSYRGGVALPSKADMDREATARNVRNLAGANWWAMQAAHQCGDHVEGARQNIARSRLLAAAKRSGLAVGV